MAELQHPKKQAKVKELSSITIGYLNSRKGSQKSRDMKRMKILLDSGCGGTLINHKLIKKLKPTKNEKVKWKTKSGTFKTNKKCKVSFTLPALFENREIDWDCYVDESSNEASLYNMIIGRDLMHELGIDLCFSTAEIKWDNASIPMVPVEELQDQNIDGLEQLLLYSQDHETTDAERIQNIVESKYCPEDLRKIVDDCKNLDSVQ